MKERVSTEHSRKPRQDSGITLLLLSVLLAVGVLEASAYVAVRVLAGGRAASLFYQPPKLTRAEYEEYLAIRDPELGWPAPRDIDGRRYDASGSRRVPAFPEPGRECVSLYGDSFTYSTEVGDNDAWGNVLATRLGCRVGNFGVGAYGTDQAVLRFERNREDRAPVTVLGFFVRDVLRNVTQYLQLDFTNAPTTFKPRFVVDAAGELRLIPLPRIAPDDLAAFGADPERFLDHETFLPGSRYGGTRIEFPYTLVLGRAISSERVRARIAGRPNWADFLTPGHASQGLEVTTGIMRRFADDCRARAKRCLVVIFPAPSSLDYLAESGASLTRELTTALDRAGIDHLDLAPGITRYLGTRPYQELLASPDGHHNPEGDRLVATLVHEHLVAGPAPIKAAERADVDGEHLPAERVIEREHVAQPERQAQHPLPDGHGRQHVIDEVRRPLGHPTPATRRTDRTRLARERHEPLGVARVAVKTCETSGPDATRDELTEFALDERRNAAAFFGRP